MSIEKQPIITLNRDDVMQVFELLIALDHHRVDLKHAMEKASISQDFSQVQTYLLAAKATLSKACQVFPQPKSPHSSDQ